MKPLSRWASRHRSLAVVLILLGELINLGNGLLLGSNGLGRLPVGSLLLILLAGLGGACWLRTQWTDGQSYARGRGLLAGAFLSNFLLFITIGGLWSASIDKPNATGSAWGSRREVVRTDSTASQVEPFRQNSQQATVRDDTPAGDQTSKRIVFVLLFILGLVLAYLLAGLSCALACSGLGFAAALLILVGIGSLGGGFFFLSRALSRQIQPWREMTPKERRKTIGRGVLLLLSTVLFFALVGAVANP